MSANPVSSLHSPRLAALCGGVGGAKLALGLERLYGEAVTIVVNTGDDFEHLGLHVSPDIDTVLYTLGERSDLDLAMHVERTRKLRAGTSLTAITRDVAARFGIAAAILPMSDDRVETTVVTPDDALPFQRYFVEKQCKPVVKRIEFKGAERARASDAVIAALQKPALDAIIICPSNPYLSIDPILSVGNLRDALKQAQVPIIVVSPLIGGAAVKGPTAKIMAEIDVPANSRAIAAHYAGLIDGIIIDESDRADAATLDLPVCVAPTLMRSLDDKVGLARTCAEFAIQLKAQTTRGTR
jgi:LPPG:FO 2-phospho-L-lactate transferase